MKSINEYTKEDLRSYIDDFEKQGLGEYECLCCYCSKCDSDDCMPEDCFPDADKEECFETYKEMVMEAYCERNSTYI